VDGFAVVDWLRRHDTLRSIPLFVYTARDLTDGDRDRLRLGHTEFMTKARVSLEQLAARTAQLLGRIHGKPLTEGEDA
jgi:CheY-like chemotaxis protein